MEQIKIADINNHMHTICMCKCMCVYIYNGRIKNSMGEEHMGVVTVTDSLFALPQPVNPATKNKQKTKYLMNKLCERSLKCLCLNRKNIDFNVCFMQNSMNLL